MLNNDIARKTARIFLKINAVSFRFNPPYVFTTGIKSPIYLDNRIIMSYPVERKKIIQFYIDIIKERIGLKNVNWISATASAAIPQGGWVAGKLNLPLVYVRPSTKSYGKGNKMEGYLKKGSKVVIVEDHISTATSVVGNAQTIKELGGKVKYCIAATTYETEISKQLLAKNRIKLFVLTTGKVIIEEAFKGNYLNKEQKKQVDAWLKDPVAWGKQFV